MIATDPIYKNYNLFYVNRTFNSDGSISNFDITSTIKSLEIAKEKMKQKPNKELKVKINELTKALIDFTENIMLEVSLEEMAYDKEEQLKDLKKITKVE